MTASDGLVPWLLEQAAEDERKARAAAPGPWMAATYVGLEYYEELGLSQLSGPRVNCDSEDEPSWDRSDAQHVATWHPARVLAECEAKRLIIERCRDLETADWTIADLAGDVLRDLALPYADRPGYREEWRP